MSSLGELLVADEESKDFLLILYDGKSEKISVQVHRLVLKINSPFFKRKLNSLFHLSFVWIVPENSIQSAISIIRYFYSHDRAHLRDCAETHVLLKSLEVELK
jgi:hypothetical protein